MSIDAYSNYGGGKQVSNANGLNIVLKFRGIFAMLGNPEQIVSDNGTPFTLRKFGEFCNQHEICHIHHPRIVLQRIKRLHALFKYLNVLFVRYSI